MPFNFTMPLKLRENGVMGMNQRNVSYIGKYNDRKQYPNVDDKLKTKNLALKHDIAVPHLIGVVRFQHEVKNIFDTLDKHNGFCIKPAKGSGGKGILVILKTDESGFKKNNGEYVSRNEVVRHLSNILAGLFSLGGTEDVALIESLIKFNPIFDQLSHEGVPDIRIITFQGYPVMAMLRLATHASDGKANLHQGAVGVGINIATGEAVSAVQYDRPIEHHPDTGKSLANIKISNWVKLLHVASGCYEMSGLGFLGADIVLDEERGPLVLELNARPGLAIQIANNAGILPRLKHIESLDRKQHINAEQRVQYVIDHFK